MRVVHDEVQSRFHAESTKQDEFKYLVARFFIERCACTRPHSVGRARTRVSSRMSARSVAR